MGSDMYMNPPTASEVRGWRGHGIIVNLETGHVIKKHNTKELIPTGYKWIDDIAKVDLAESMLKNVGPRIVLRSKKAKLI